MVAVDFVLLLLLLLLLSVLFGRGGVKDAEGENNEDVVVVFMFDVLFLLLCSNDCKNDADNFGLSFF